MSLSASVAKLGESVLVRTVRRQLPVCLRIERFGVDAAPFLRSLEKFASDQQEREKKNDWKKKKFHKDPVKKRVCIPQTLLLLPCSEGKHPVSMHLHDLHDECRNDQQKRQDGRDRK